MRLSRIAIRLCMTYPLVSCIAEKKVVKKRKSGSSDYSGSENGSSPKARARKKKHPQRKNDTLPDWTKKRPKEIV